jgi:hypothetical protein
MGQTEIAHQIADARAFAAAAAEAAGRRPDDSLACLFFVRSAVSHGQSQRLR